MLLLLLLIGGWAWCRAATTLAELRGCAGRGPWCLRPLLVPALNWDGIEWKDLETHPQFETERKWEFFPLLAVWLSGPQQTLLQAGIVSVGNGLLSYRPIGHDLSSETISHFSLCWFTIPVQALIGSLVLLFN